MRNYSKYERSVSSTPCQILFHIDGELELNSTSLPSRLACHWKDRNYGEWSEHFSQASVAGVVA